MAGDCSVVWLLAAERLPTFCWFGVWFIDALSEFKSMSELDGDAVIVEDWKLALFCPC